MKLGIILCIFTALIQSPTWAQENLGPEACHRIQDLYSQGQNTVQTDGRNLFFTLSGNFYSIPCSDSQNLGFYDRIDHMDVRSLFAYIYPFGSSTLPETRLNYDPGRLRIESLLQKAYGDSPRAVEANLIKINFLNQKIFFQKNLSAATNLSHVNDELMKLLQTDPEVKKFLQPFLSGKSDLREMTYEWRPILGTNRLSAHSYGIAIDLLTELPAQYWLWDEMKTNPTKAKLGENAYRNDHFIPSKTPYFPIKIVQIFEKYGFIWGGKWNHYDTMHFEYRPEFLRQF